MLHELPLERRTLHGHFSRDLEPVLTIEAGDGIVLRALESGWHTEPGVFFEPRDPELDGGHALVGPIQVRGALEGQTLAVRVDRVLPGAWGASPAGGFERVLQWELDPGLSLGRDDRGRSVELQPFLGVLGMPPPEPGRHSTIPPRRWGGNIDCKELVRGSTLWLTFGFHDDLDAAAVIATNGMIEVMERELGIDRSDGLGLASVVVDLRITQVVNGAKGVHAVLRHDAIRPAQVV